MKSEFRAWLTWYSGLKFSSSWSEQQELHFSNGRGMVFLFCLKEENAIYPILSTIRNETKSCKSCKIMLKMNDSWNLCVCEAEWFFEDSRKVMFKMLDDTSQGARAGGVFNKLHQEVCHHQGGWGHSLDWPQCWDKSQNLGFLRNSVFFDFGPKKIFLSPNNLIWPQKPHFWGGHSFKTFWSKLWFWSYIGKIANFWYNQPWNYPKPWHGSKSVRSMSPQKVWFLRPNKVFRAQKVFLAPKNQKNWFSSMLKT